tara:strand:- start:1342 stop:1764 length:423 start_codon:yes stop_codon:yes gene_type:complete
MTKWQDILKVSTEDAISDAKRFGNIDAELNTPNPEMVKIVRFISDFGKKHDLEGFEKLEEYAQYGSTTEGQREWKNIDMRGSPPAIWFEDSPLNDIINTSAKTSFIFEMKEKIRDAVKEKFGGFLYADEGWGLVTYRENR